MNEPPFIITAPARILEALCNKVEEEIMKVVFDTTRYENLETVQALLILALWLPPSQGNKIHDGSGLIANAASMAANLGLSSSMRELEYMQRGEDVYGEEEWRHAELRVQVVGLLPDLKSLISFG